MKAIVHEHFQAELSKAQTLIAQQDFASAWIALQRAHILGQNDAIAHTIAHWQMLKLAWKQRDFREIMGQLVSTILAIPLTLLYGNSRYLRGGKAHVQESEKMSIPEDIQQILSQ
ncbi:MULTISPECIES: DUF3703 domain-containing protein [Calothrix]|uniref:DUF3703 domain-containing protein n=2 Tax=Calothrix TaxID=1186 RepID=A0ABR8ALG9_9CYAN|nr:MULTISPECIES: DUF3703 domain-containing protein [Calothrix]MBD2200138.1 DUF3703 domain-containing protein [Calothrix parietina FACHB-288]MBD2229111.1 DUF3703 domain-containing protein [Calothrix anomala FACHB-343]